MSEQNIADAEMWSLERIKPYERNPRVHPAAQVELLARMILKYGPDQPIVVDEVGVILKGHGRLLAARHAGIAAFPVIQRTGMSEAEKIEMRIADNKVAMLSGWDQELLRFEVGELSAGSSDLTLLGFQEADLTDLLQPPSAPDQFRAYGEDIETTYRCPRCNYAWSGNPDGGIREVKDGTGGDG